MASPRKLTRPIWHLPMSGTDACYSSNAARFVADTVDIEMSDLHERFLAFVPAGGLILDAGGGSGRDSKAFLERGFRVRALDASAEVARLAEALIGQPVDILTFDDLTDVACYDGIWACASLVHALIRRRTIAASKLFTGGAQRPFLPHLCTAIASAHEIYLAVAFIKTTGLRLMLPDLHGALNNGGMRARPRTRLRILTSDYLDVTDPEALRLLMLLQEMGAQVRVFEAASSSFHMKAYLFAHISEDRHLHGTGFIGSSNISRQALSDGLEWNYRVDFPGDDGFLEARTRFEELFRHQRTVALTDPWIDRYEARRIPPQRPVAPGSEETELPPTPTPVQIDALAALYATRSDGYRRGLVVLATGLGKTWLAAFDAEQAGSRRVLFVAHREEILNQAAETFVRIRPRARVGFLWARCATPTSTYCARRFRRSDATRTSNAFRRSISTTSSLTNFTMPPQRRIASYSDTSLHSFCSASPPPRTGPIRPPRRGDPVPQSASPLRGDHGIQERLSYEFTGPPILPADGSMNPSRPSIYCCITPWLFPNRDGRETQRSFFTFRGFSCFLW